MCVWITLICFCLHYSSGDAEGFLKFQNECLERDLDEDREGIISRIVKTDS